ncbi:hypothetical protein J2792_003699 [Novosphingobium capsulatum]|uniref:Uncharacterized protein n=1 Tax=Novosphingobium capsulatum TaxID=13688 RepID=A0ABU1MSH8_9SPHN|nr:hypothetical protein [Novosphingobium capsulatum]
MAAITPIQPAARNAGRKGEVAGTCPLGMGDARRDRDALIMMEFFPFARIGQRRPVRMGSALLRVIFIINHVDNDSHFLLYRAKPG